VIDGEGLWHSLEVNHPSLETSVGTGQVLREHYRKQAVCLSAEWSGCRGGGDNDDDGYKRVVPHRSRHDDNDDS